MNKLAIFLFLHVVVVDNIKDNDVIEISTINSSLFRETNLNLDKVFNELFNNLKIHQNYTETTKMKLLTFIDERLRNVSEANFKMYTDIKNIAKCNPNDNTTNALFNLTNIIEEIFKILQFNAYTATNIFDIEMGDTKAVIKILKLKQNYTTSKGIADMIKFFIKRKDSNCTHQISSVNNNTDLKEKGKNIGATHLKRKRLRHFDSKLLYNLKAWRRPINNGSEFSTNADNRRVYKGSKVSIRRYPFIASVHVMGEFMCSGSIIGRDLIITSAFCLQIAYGNPQVLQKPNSVTVRAGTALTRKGGVVLPVVEIHFHPMYDPQYFANNLAIARINTNLAFRSDENKMRRIEFDTVKAKLPEMGRVTILGWGNKDSYTRYAGPLTMAHLDVYKLEDCKEIYTENYIRDTNFCAGFVNVGGGACQRDGGGPGLKGNLLVGVVSFGPPVCGTRDAPTVFTKVGFYSEWIDHVIKKVLRASNKTFKAVTFGQVQNPNSVPKQKQIQKQIFPSEVLTLKRLYIKYIMSGKMDIPELINGEQNFRKNDSIKNKVNTDLDDKEPTIYDKIKNVVESQNTKIKHTENVKHERNVTPDAYKASMDDVKSNLHSLSDKFESTKKGWGSDEEMEGSVSIDMEYITRSSKATAKSTVGYKEDLYSHNSNRPTTKKPTTTPAKRDLIARPVQVKTTVSKYSTFIETTPKYEILYPWGTEYITRSAENIVRSTTTKNIIRSTRTENIRTSSTMKTRVLPKNPPSTSTTALTVTTHLRKKAKKKRKSLRVDFEDDDGIEPSADSNDEMMFQLK